MRTIDIHKTSTMSDETFRCPQQIVEAYAEAYPLDHLKRSCELKRFPHVGQRKRTLFAYLLLMLSSIASILCLEKSFGAISTRSAILVCEKVSWRCFHGGAVFVTRMNMMGNWAHQ